MPSVGLSACRPVHLFVCMYRRAPRCVWMVKRILFIFDAEKFICQRSMPGDYEYFGPKNTKWWLSLNRLEFQWCIKTTSLNKNAWVGGIFRIMTVCALGTQMLNVDFVSTCFTDSMDFTVVRYLVISNRLSSNTRFRFNGNVVRVSRIWQSIHNDLEPICILSYPQSVWQSTAKMTSRFWWIYMFQIPWFRKRDFWYAACLCIYVYMYQWRSVHVQSTSPTRTLTNKTVLLSWFCGSPYTDKVKASSATSSKSMTGVVSQFREAYAWHPYAQAQSEETRHLYRLVKRREYITFQAVTLRKQEILTHSS
jgi:hypothetical protein